MASAEDRTSFDAAVSLEARRLFTLAMTILADPAEAEDVVQETFLVAWLNWSKVGDSNSLSAWLTRVCVNRCIDFRRALLRRRTSVTALADRVSRSSDPDLAPDLADFQRAYLRLSRKQRTAFALHFHHGYTLDECAALMGCRPGTARSHLARAVARLRKEMDDA